MISIFFTWGKKIIIKERKGNIKEIFEKSQVRFINFWREWKESKMKY